jgi:pyruvate/2-oxoglutarate dehydrogenase complex dihydrolipoamide acyltransferase (E2) component
MGRKEGIDLSELEGSGPGGHIIAAGGRSRRVPGALAGGGTRCDFRL